MAENEEREKWERIEERENEDRESGVRENEGGRQWNSKNTEREREWERKIERLSGMREN